MKKIILLGASSFFPSLVFAAPPVGSLSTIDSVLLRLTSIINIIAPTLITIAVIFFIWTIIQYTFTTDDKKKESAKKGIINALIGIFIIASFWGIIALVQRTFGVQNAGELGSSGVGNIFDPVPY